jgi:glutathione S-transferase
MKPLILYGVPLSQPVRAVMWLLLMKRIPFEMVLINPGSTGDNGSRSPAYLAKNPGGTVPCIEEPETGFTLGEGHAIMTYLARTNHWTDVYPDDERVRATIDSYLHYHHRNVREASIGLMTPKLRKDLDIPEVMQASAIRTLKGALGTLESLWLADSQFLVGDSVTIADLAAYVEIGQLQPQFANVFDLSGYPNVQSWLNAMQQVDSHDDVHVVLAEMGDISRQAPTMDTIRNANKQALRALKERLADL